MTIAQNYFEENNYVVIKEFLTAEMAEIFYQYTKTVTQAVDYKIQVDKPHYNESWDGGFGDGQVPDTFYRYGDPLIDTLMIMSLNKMQEFTGLTLVPNYTYWRLYQKGNELKRHTDRGSCEISATLCLGYDVSNVDSNIHPDFDWPMFVADKTGKEIPVHMKPGDLIVYRGIEIEHWRERFIGLNHSQVFIHYNDVNGPVRNYLDGRHIIGIPK
jgi:hypothetical protein